MLGCWKPNMAVLMSPTEHANIWKAESEVISLGCMKIYLDVQKEMFKLRCFDIQVNFSIHAVELSFSE